MPTCLHPLPLPSLALLLASFLSLFLYPSVSLPLSVLSILSFFFYLSFVTLNATQGCNPIHTILSFSRIRLRVAFSLSLIHAITFFPLFSSFYYFPHGDLLLFYLPFLLFVIVPASIFSSLVFFSLFSKAIPKA